MVRRRTNTSATDSWTLLPVVVSSHETDPSCRENRVTDVERTPSGRHFVRHLTEAADASIRCRDRFAISMMYTIYSL